MTRSWRARRKTTRRSKPAAGLLLAPLRWYTEDVAVHRLAVTASRIAFSISLSRRSAGVRRIVASPRSGGWVRWGSLDWVPLVSGCGCGAVRIPPPGPVGLPGPRALAGDAAEDKSFLRGGARACPLTVVAG